ncbi:MAG: hypothetical protein AAF432_16115 [Planctomycetota bacterium]
MNDNMLQETDHAITPQEDGAIDGFTGVDDVGGFDPLAGAEVRGKAPTGALILVGAVVLATAGVWSMRFIASATAKSSEHQESVEAVEQFITTLSQTPNTKTVAKVEKRKESLVVLNTAYEERKIPLRDVQRNPFILFIEPTTDGPLTIENADDLAAAQFAERRQERMDSIELAANGLELKMVLGGSRPLANINGEIVGIDDVVFQDGVEFTVRDITADEVFIDAIDTEFDVTMEFMLSIERLP